jgi:hypothetical protein
MPGGGLDVEMTRLIHEVHSRIRDIELQLDVLKPIASKLIEFTGGVSSFAMALQREPAKFEATRCE